MRGRPRIKYKWNADEQSHDFRESSRDSWVCDEWGKEIGEMGSPRKNPRGKAEPSAEGCCYLEPEKVWYRMTRAQGRFSNLPRSYYFWPPVNTEFQGTALSPGFFPVSSRVDFFSDEVNSLISIVWSLEGCTIQSLYETLIIHLYNTLWRILSVL